MNIFISCVVLLVAVLLPPSALRADTAATPTTVVSFAEAADRAIRANPELQSMRLELGIAAGELTQAGLARNPELSLEAEDLLGSGAAQGVDAAEFTFRIDQQVLLGGKRSKARNVARAELLVAELAYQALRSTILARLRAAFVDGLAAQQRVQLLRGFVDIAHENVAVVAQRVRAGAANEADLARARIAAARAELDALRADRAWRRALEQVHALLGGGPVPAWLEGTLDAPPELPDLETLRAQLERAPALQVRQAAIERARFARQQARAQRVPDLTVGAGLKWLNEGGDVAAVAGLSLPLPLVDRNQGARAAAVARERQAEAEAAAARIALDVELRQVWTEYELGRAELERIEQDMLPGARQAHEASRTLFARGRFSYLELLDAQRTLFAIEERRIDALASMHRAAATIAGLLGAASTPNFQ